jgi:hypothetical protein
LQSLHLGARYPLATDLVLNTSSPVMLNVTNLQLPLQQLASLLSQPSL